MRTFSQKSKTTQPTTSTKSSTRSRTRVGQSHDPTSILNLQRTIGNQALQRILRSHAEEPELKAGLTVTTSPRSGHNFARIPVSPSKAGTLQTKLAINEPGDKYEQEADRVADQVMRMPEPKLQHACACGGTPGRTGECEECGKKRLSLQRMSLNVPGPVAAGFAPPIVHDVLRSPARSLDPQTRASMELHFGHDFSRVRIHTGDLAARSAEAVQAQAFTFGSDIVFGSGKFAPSTPAGRKLLAHELTHVVQQGAAPAAHPPAEAAGGGTRPVAPRPANAGNQLRRQPAPGPSSPPSVSPTAGLAPSTISACRIEFRQGTTDAVDPAARDACLETARAYVEAGGGQATLELHGYASEEGDPQFNADLARRRAETVKRLLVARKVPAAAISAVGHSVDRTYPGLAPNRRVEVVLLTSLTFPGDEITIPKFVCGPDVTKQVEDAVAKARSLFAAWTAEQKDESCEDLRGITTGSYAWDIVELHNNGWILSYRPLCATQGATPPCGSTVQVGRECYYAGSPNYVIFGTMCRLCYDHFYAQGRAGANVGYTGWMDFTEKSMLDLIDLYKSGSGNVAPSKAWAVAGRDGWPSGGKPPKGDRPGCAPQCSQPYTGPAFRVNWYPYEFHTGGGS